MGRHRRENYAGTVTTSDETYSTFTVTRPRGLRRTRDGGEHRYDVFSTRPFGDGQSTPLSPSLTHLDGSVDAQGLSFPDNLGDQESTERHVVDWLSPGHGVSVVGLLPSPPSCARRGPSSPPSPRDQCPSPFRLRLRRPSGTTLPNLSGTLLGPPSRP